MSKDLSTATTRVLARVIRVLQSTLAITCDAIKDVGLYLPAPATSAYYWLGDPSGVDEILPNHNVAAFVYPAGPRGVIERRTGGPSTYSALTQIPIEVMLSFQVAPQSPIAAPGWDKQLTSDEMLILRCQRYAGAIQESVLTYAINPDDVTDLDPVSESYELASLEIQTIGICRVTFNVLQDVQIPRPLYTIP